MQGRSILFVDDDVLTQWITSDVLQGAGFHVVSACRGGEAIDLLRENADFDLLMTEVDLPDHMTGMHLGEHWRRLFPNRPIIYTSSSSTLTLTRLAPHDAYVAKPFRIERLLRIINQIIGDYCFRPAASCGIRPSHHVN